VAGAWDEIPFSTICKSWGKLLSSKPMLAHQAEDT